MLEEHRVGKRRSGLQVAGRASVAQVGSRDIAGDLGWRVYAEARKRGAYLRPLGDTVYICPPLTINDSELEELLTIVQDSIKAVLP